MRADDRHLGSVQKIETVLYLGPKRPTTVGTPLANLAPVKAEARNKTDPMHTLQKRICICPGFNRDPSLLFPSPERYHWTTQNNDVLRAVDGKTLF